MVGVNLYQVFKNGFPASSICFGSRKCADSWLYHKKEKQLPYELFTEKKENVAKYFKKNIF